METEDLTFLCPNCYHYMERVLMPNSTESADLLGIDPDDFDANGGEPVAQLTCLILGMDLAFDVLECNKFTKKLPELIPRQFIY